MNIIDNIRHLFKGYFMDNKYFSVSQFAEMANVTRQTIYRRLDKELKDFVVKENNKIKISKDALFLFDKSVSNFVTDNNENEIICYNNQMAKNEELIETNVALLSNLVRSQNKKIEKIDNLLNTINELNNTIKDMQKTIDKLSDKKKSLFKRLFSRKGGDK